MSYTKKEYLAPVPATARGQAVRLTADPSGTRFVYANGKSIIIRSIETPEKAVEYREHISNTTVARFSPSGYYVASGDVSGNVRIWDSINEEHILKSEFRPISGRINDIAWDCDSQRIMAVGDGKDRFGHVFSFDSGNSLGTIDGHSKLINACDMRPVRPFRAVTCSDDNTCVFFHGPPYKFNKTLKNHSGFVNDVRYSPSGEYFVSVGSDKKIILYDGKTGDFIREIGAGCSDAHSGSIFSVSWSPDNKYIVTSSGDMTCKFWDVAEDKLVHSVNICPGPKSSPKHQQVGNLWAGDHIISISLSGDINMISMDSDAPIKTITGHQKSITAGTLTNDKMLYTGSYDGKVCSWDLKEKSYPVSSIEGIVSDGTQINAVAAAFDNGGIALGSIDNTIRFIGNSSSALPSPSIIGLSAAPKSLAMTASGSTAVAVLENDDLVVVYDGKVTKAPIKETTAAPRSVAISSDSELVAVGFDNNSVLTYKLLANNELEFTGVKIDVNRRDVTALAFSPSGEYLASGDSSGKIYVVKSTTGDLVTERWASHTARIYSIDWSPDSSHAASASLDSHVYVWSIDKPLRKIHIRNAHLGGAYIVRFVDNDTVVSAGSDAGVKIWSVTYA